MLAANNPTGVTVVPEDLTVAPHESYHRYTKDCDREYDTRRAALEHTHLYSLLDRSFSKVHVSDLL